MGFALQEPRSATLVGRPAGVCDGAEALARYTSEDCAVRLLDLQSGRKALPYYEKLLGQRNLRFDVVITFLSLSSGKLEEAAMSSDYCPYCHARFEIKAVAIHLKGASVIRTCPHCALVSVTTPAALPQSIGSDRDAYKFGQARGDTVAPLIAARADARRQMAPISG